ncbi:MAG: glycyl-radical enzyme activating protein [bacterium]|nr:glycyl-radical enzyme activating protein [bacterium]
MSSGVVFNIQRYSVHDGPGIRVTVFFKGCSLRCWWCHNPESQEVQPECVKQIVKLDEDSYVTEDELIGKVMTVAEVIREIEKEQLFLDESGGGVTFSGGEPFMQPEFLNALLRACRKREIHSAVDTTGYAPPEVFESILDDVDLFLYDLKLIDDELHRKYTGVSNEGILQNLQTLAEYRKAVAIRFPVIPGITDTERNIADILRLIGPMSNIQRIHLLPFHKIAEGKYQKFGLENKLRDLKAPASERMEELRQQFQQLSFSVQIGG